MMNKIRNKYKQMFSNLLLTINIEYIVNTGVWVYNITYIYHNYVLYV